MMFVTSLSRDHVSLIPFSTWNNPTSMITANQLRAARALLNIDQRQTADLADLSVPTIQRMEASDGVIRANVGSLMKLISALENAGLQLINPWTPSPSEGRRVR